MEGRTSGGPIVNEHGELVAIASMGTGPDSSLITVMDGDTANLSIQPYVCRALPVWALSEITSEQPPDRILEEALRELDLSLESDLA